MFGGHGVAALGTPRTPQCAARLNKCYARPASVARCAKLGSGKIARSCTGDCAREADHLREREARQEGGGPAGSTECHGDSTQSLRVRQTCVKYAVGVLTLGLEFLELAGAQALHRSRCPRGAEGLTLAIL